MDTLQSFDKNKADIAKGNKSRIFDWAKCVEILLEQKPEKASAGLQNDLAWTGGVIFECGETITDNYTLLQSTWATPILVNEDTGEEIECWRYVKDEGETEDAKTQWPDYAYIAIKDKIPCK